MPRSSLSKLPNPPVCAALVAQWIEHQTSNLGVAGSSPARGISFCHHAERGSGSLVVMTSALHAEGREFNPRPEYLLLEPAAERYVLPVWPSGKATAS